MKKNNEGDQRVRLSDKAVMARESLNFFAAEFMRLKLQHFELQLQGRLGSTESSNVVVMMTAAKNQFERERNILRKLGIHLS